MAIILPVLCMSWGNLPQAAVHDDETRTVILEMAEESLGQRYSSDQYRFELKARWIPGTVLNAKPEHILDVQPEGAIDTATNFMVVYLTQTGRSSAQVQLSIQAEKRIPLAKSRIVSGEKLTPDKFEVRWIPVSIGRVQLVESVVELEGKTLRRTLNPGQPVRNADISSQYLIEAGETVTMIYEANGIEIGLTAIARENGAAGEEINLFSKDTRKRYVGRIQSPGTVIWIQTL